MKTNAKKPDSIKPSVLTASASSHTPPLTPGNNPPLMDHSTNTSDGLHHTGPTVTGAIPATTIGGTDSLSGIITTRVVSPGGVVHNIRYRFTSRRPVTASAAVITTGSPNGSTAVHSCSFFPTVISGMQTTGTGPGVTAIKAQITCHFIPGMVDGRPKNAPHKIIDGPLTGVTRSVVPPSPVPSTSNKMCPGCHIPVTGSNVEVVWSLGTKTKFRSMVAHIPRGPRRGPVGAPHVVAHILTTLSIGNGQESPGTVGAATGGILTSGGIGMSAGMTTGAPATSASKQGSTLTGS